jgi:hypothetical protein
MSIKYPNAHFLKVDVDECPETTVAYNVHSMPTFIFLRNKIRLVLKLLASGSCSFYTSNDSILRWPSTTDAKVGIG